MSNNEPRYVVAAPACYVTTEQGTFLLYRDAPVPEGARDVEQLLEDGFVRELADLGDGVSEVAGGLQSDLPPDLSSPAEPLSPEVAGDTGTQPDGADEAEVDSVPPKSAPKADWVDHAVAVQVAQGSNEADARALADALTKDQLIEQYGQA